MATSQVSICNMALSHCGVSATISSIDESSKEAASCKLFYDQAIDECLKDFPWPFATRIEALALVEENPNTDWAKSYRYPANAVTFRRILNGISRLESAGGYISTAYPYSTRFGPFVTGTRIPFRIASDDAGKLIYADQPDLFGEYTAYITDPNKFPPDFTEAVSLLLATMIAPRVTMGDQFKLGARAFQLYRAKMAQAATNAANEEAPDQPVESSFITSRD